MNGKQKLWIKSRQACSFHSQIVIWLCFADDLPNSIHIVRGNVGVNFLLLDFQRYVRLSLVAFQLWGVLEQLAPEFFLNYFFKTGDLSMVQLTQNMQKISKK